MMHTFCASLVYIKKLNPKGCLTYIGPVSLGRQEVSMVIMDHESL